MSKGLKLLNKKRTSIPTCECYCTTRETIKQIEKELKDYEEIKSICSQYGIEFTLAKVREALFTLAQLKGEYGNNWANYNKKIKALEIIKEKRVDTVAFIRCYIASNKRDEEIVSMYNKICADPFVPFSKQKKTITIEECALLKDVLL